jgi:hypothetical protein
MPAETPFPVCLDRSAAREEVGSKSRAAKLGLENAFDNIAGNVAAMLVASGWIEATALTA